MKFGTKSTFERNVGMLTSNFIFDQYVKRLLMQMRQIKS